MLDQQPVQVISCQGAKNEISSQRSAPLQQSQPTTQKLLPFYSLTCKVLEQQQKQALRFKERLKKKPDTGETYFVHSLYSEETLPAYFRRLLSTLILPAGRYKGYKICPLQEYRRAAIVLHTY